MRYTDWDKLEIVIIHCILTVRARRRTVVIESWKKKKQVRNKIKSKVLKLSIRWNYAFQLKIELQKYL